MTSENSLDLALANLDPHLEAEYIFASLESVPPGLDPFAVVHEPEGYTVVVLASQAAQYGLATEERYARITAQAHTSLQAVAITATVTSTIASRGIACNVIAGYHHDHFFVPAERAGEALALMQALSNQAAGWLPSDAE